MPSSFPLDQVSEAMVALGTTLPAFDGEPISVAALGNDDFSDDGDLVVKSPSVRIRMVDGVYSAKETQKLTYQGDLQFAVLVYCENLRSQNDERLDSLRLLGQVLNCYAGARLQLADGGWTQPLQLFGVSPVMNEGKVIDQYYSAAIGVQVLAQFPGENAHFGEK